MINAVHKTEHITHYFLYSQHKNDFDIIYNKDHAIYYYISNIKDNRRIFSYLLYKNKIDFLNIYVLGYKYI
jgi:hypothetical protein